MATDAPESKPKRKRKSNKSKKGNQFARELCPILSRWFTKGERDDAFWLTSQSGGRATVRAEKGKKTHGQHGDIAATDHAGKELTDVFTIECKRGYSNTTIFDLMDRGGRHEKSQQQFEEWLQQVFLSHKNSGSQTWMIIHRRDTRYSFVYLDEAFANVLIHPDEQQEIQFLRMRCGVKTTKSTLKIVDVFGCLLSDFMDIVTPSRIANVARKPKDA